MEGYVTLWLSKLCLLRYISSGYAQHTASLSGSLMCYEMLSARMSLMSLRCIFSSLSSSINLIWGQLCWWVFCGFGSQFTRYVLTYWLACSWNLLSPMKNADILINSVFLFCTSPYTGNNANNLKPSHLWSFCGANIKHTSLSAKSWIFKM